MVLSLAILGPLLAPGYIFALDMVFGPNIAQAYELYGLQGGILNGLPLIFIVHLLNKLIPAWLLQKVLLFLILFLAGLGAYYLCPARKVGKHFAGLLYMLNPFVYARFLAGQRGLLLAYAVTPFAIKAFIELLEDRNWKKAVKVALLTTLAGVFMVQALFLLFLAYLILVLLVLGKEFRSQNLLKSAAQVGGLVSLSALMFLALNLYWLLPSLSTVGPMVGQITELDFLVFAPTPASRIAFDLASMHGFWRAGYLYTRDVLPLWWLVFLFILFLVSYGLVCRYDDRKIGWSVKSFALMGAAGLLLAGGYALEITRPIYEWLLRHLPLFSAFRDSQKFVALLCLTYAYLGGLGVNALAAGLTKEKLKRIWQQTALKKTAMLGTATIVAFALASPVVYSFAMFGFQKQLQVADYPAEWYEVDQYLSRDEQDFNVLFLPWHLYMDYSWIPQPIKRVGNLPSAFFSKPVISGDNIEIGVSYTQSTNPISAYVEFLLRNSAEISNFGELVSPLNVKYVILVGEADYQDYDFLYEQDDLTKVMSLEGITLFRNEHFTSRVYSADSAIYLKDWAQYLELSQTQDVMEHVYLLGEGADESGTSGTEAVSYTRKSEASYQLAGSARKYTIFTVPQRMSTDGWEYENQPVLKNLGFMPAFPSEADGGVVAYTRFYRFYLPADIASVVSLIVLVVLLSIRRKVSLG
jgi:hypothetical protein